MHLEHLARFCRLNGVRAVCSVVLALGAATTPTTSSAAGPATTVDIVKFGFVPKDITVAPGTRVRWTNHDETPHTVASQPPSKVFASKAMDTDDQYEFVFDSEGDFAYFCTVHPFMTGTVHVRKPQAPVR